jgi:hypothetical protein
MKRKKPLVLSEKDERFHKKIDFHVGDVLDHEIKLAQYDKEYVIGRHLFDFQVTIPMDPHDDESGSGLARTSCSTLELAVKKAIVDWRKSGGGFHGFLSHHNFTVLILLPSGRQVLVPNEFCKDTIHKALHDLDISHHDHYFEK